VLLPPPLLLLLQEYLCLPLGLLEQLQLLQLLLLLLLELLEPLRLLLLGRLALLPLLPLLPSLLLQVFVQGLLALSLQPDGRLDGWGGKGTSVGTWRGAWGSWGRGAGWARTEGPLLALPGVGGTHLVGAGGGLHAEHAPLPIPVGQHLQGEDTGWHHPPVPRLIPAFFGRGTGSPTLTDVKLSILGFPFPGSEGGLLHLLSPS